MKVKMFCADVIALAPNHCPKICFHFRTASGGNLSRFPDLVIIRVEAFHSSTPKMAAMDESFFLTKNNYDESTKTIFKSLLTDVEFTDVTLACSDQKQVRGHKAILGASSSFFRTVFKQNPAANLVLYLKGVSTKDLGSIMEFIYLGQTSVNKSDLTTFLEAAEELKVEGLIQPNKPPASNSSQSFQNSTSPSFLGSSQSYQSVPEITIDETASSTEAEFTSSSYASSGLESMGTLLETSGAAAADPSELTFSVTPEFSSTMLPLPAAPEPYQPQTYKCGECPSSFESIPNLKRHAACHKKQNITNDHVANGSIRYEEGSGKYHCSQCVFSSVHRRSALRHFASIHAPPTVKQEQDTADTVGDAAMPAATPEDQEKEKKYKCDQCDFTSAHRASSKRHAYLVHGVEFKTAADNTQMKRHSCFACEFRTDHTSSLRRHIETLHPEKQIPAVVPAPEM